MIGPGSSWPPPDPDRIARHVEKPGNPCAFTYQGESSSTEKYMEAFHQRQNRDFKRFISEPNSSSHRRPFRERYRGREPDGSSELSPLTASDQEGGEEEWQNSEGERLKDYGVDEETEFYQEDDLPLAELLRRRRPQVSSTDAHTVSGHIR